MIKLELLDPNHVRRARKWCVENFGAIPLHDITIKCRSYPQYAINPFGKTRIEKLLKESPENPGGKYKWKMITRVYDVENARWMHRSKDGPFFRFRDEEDAMAFKLMWL